MSLLPINFQAAANEPLVNTTMTKGKQRGDLGVTVMHRCGSPSVRAANCLH